jgi:hypothetical protein
MAKNNDSTANVARFKELKAETMATTGLSEGPRLNYIATMLLRAEQLQATVLTGGDVPVSDLLALRDCIEQVSPIPPHPPLEVFIIEPDGRRIELGELQREGAEEARREREAEEALAASAPAPATSPAPAPSPAPPNQPPLAAKPAPAPPPKQSASLNVIPLKQPLRSLDNGAPPKSVT